MKKSILRILLLSLSVLAVLLLAACGKGDSAANNAGTTPAPGVSQEKAEYAYRSDFTTIQKTNDNYPPSPFLYTGNGYYAMGSEVVGTRELPEGATVEYEGQYDIYATILYFVKPDGSVEKLENFEPVLPAEDTEGLKEFSSYASLQKPQLTPDGNLIALIENYKSWFDGPEDLSDPEEMWQYYKYEQTYQILTIAPDGTRLSLADVDFDEPDAYLNGYYAAVDADGNLLVTQDTNILAIAPDGSIAYTISGEDYFYSLLKLPDGRIRALDWGVSLTPPREAGGAAFVGIRMHDIQPAKPGEQGANILFCTVEEEIENPFSMTVMLRCGEKSSALLGWELDKEEWARLRGETVSIRLPENALLLLEE